MNFSAPSARKSAIPETKGRRLDRVILSATDIQLENRKFLGLLFILRSSCLCDFTMLNMFTD
jgi:hypothetical protein